MSPYFSVEDLLFARSCFHGVILGKAGAALTHKLSSPLTAAIQEEMRCPLRPKERFHAVT